MEQDRAGETRGVSMQISISNIAWEKEDEPEIAEILGRLGVTAVDVAPGKYFPDMAAASDSDIMKVRRWWEERGISIYGISSPCLPRRRGPRSEPPGVRFPEMP